MILLGTLSLKCKLNLLNKPYFNMQICGILHVLSQSKAPFLDCRLLHVCACAASSLQQCCAQHVSWGGENMCFAVRHQREPNSALTWVLILMCRGACPAGVRCDHEPDTRRPRGSVRTSGYLGARGGPASVADSAAKNSKRKFCPRCYKMHTRAHT